jgi:hypothetical protein
MHSFLYFYSSLFSFNKWRPPPLDSLVVVGV